MIDSIKPKVKDEIADWVIEILIFIEKLEEKTFLFETIKNDM